MVTVEVRVLGGLPLKCEAEIGSRYEETTVEDMVLVDRNGRRADWAERRMTDNDWRECEDAVMDYLYMYGEPSDY